MLIRTYADFEALPEGEKLTDAEELLIENCKTGEITFLGDGKRPEGPSDERTIRAGLLRYLILGGCQDCPVHEWGVTLFGAWISGKLDLSFATAKGATNFSACGFERGVLALQARFEDLVLTNSAFPLLIAQGVQVKGNVLLRGLESSGEVRLSAAQIGGQLDCENAELNGGGAKALNAQSALIVGSVFLDGLESTGEINLSGAKIGGQLNCTNAEFNGGTRIAINAQRLTVKEGFVWRQVKRVDGEIDLNAANVSDLVDDAESWDKVTYLSFVGLIYKNLAGPLDLDMRKVWLKKGAKFNGEFHPQPYQQLAKFYRDSGHRREAREVLIANEIEQRKAARDQKLLQAIDLRRVTGSDRAEIGARFFNDFNLFWDGLTRRIAGYGYKPWLSIGTLMTLVLIATGLSLTTWRSGDFAPNSDVLLNSTSWQYYANATDEAGDPAYVNPAHCWSKAPVDGSDDCGETPYSESGQAQKRPDHPGRDYETFVALYYGFDVVVPIINLGQTHAWAPSTSRGPVGWWFFYLEKILVIFGWVVTAIAAASVTNMIRRDD